MSDSIHELIEALQSEVSVSFNIDEPSNPEGEWWVDIEIDGMRSNVLWQPALGFGLFTDVSDYGRRPQEIYKNPVEASARILQLAAQWRKDARIHPLSLRELRHLLGETQSDLAHNLGTDQARVSRMEKGADIKVSALINYLRAMGGRLELRAHFPTFEAPIEPVDPVAIKPRLN
jgi:DNA-binding XRE family transcriptional regulator